MNQTKWNEFLEESEKLFDKYDLWKKGARWMLNENDWGVEYVFHTAVHKDRDGIEMKEQN